MTGGPALDGDEPADGLRVRLVPRLGPTVADYPPGSTFGPRLARTYEFVWILSGSATWLWDGMTVPLAPGTLLLVRPGMRDTFRWDRRRPTRHAYVHFRLSGPAASAVEWPIVRDLTARPDPMGALCQYLLWLGSACPPAWREHVRETLRLLVLTFAAAPPRSERRDGPAMLPEPIVAAISSVRLAWADGVARPVTLADLADAAGVSISTLCRVFRRQFGIGPVAALERLRLARAEPLLWMSNLSLNAVALQCGFADAYHFSRRFRAIYGVAPSAFRSAAPETAPPSPLDASGLAALEPLL
ncbi:helix-turn-helix transcriptional regulator [Jiangella asiatica]|uniref:AraC family transcriptional regulator n=1 Tax=Jiangella asiatica TaxID=2530372 RepID=A0A4R5D8M5_9ACTN|nr:AraC family transcriptional regulator [Jiangella asiatica]TDE09067.1 AraC family transcriptional regulator [Jiangella asiatica]